MSDPDRPGFHHRSQAAVGALCPWHRHAGARTQQRLEPSQGDRATDVRVRHTKKIIDCYVALIGIWEPGDRIYLFGFSRGAYTARCLSHVLEVCGIPRNEPSGESISLDPKSLRRVAKEAVSCVYWLGMPRDSAEIDKRAEHFCSAYKSEVGRTAGASAYFIGIWDAVAAIGGNVSSQIGPTTGTSRQTSSTRGICSRSTRAGTISSGCHGKAFFEPSSDENKSSPAEMKSAPSNTLPP